MSHMVQSEIISFILVLDKFSFKKFILSTSIFEILLNISLFNKVSVLVFEMYHHSSKLIIEFNGIDDNSDSSNQDITSQESSAKSSSALIISGSSESSRFQENHISSKILFKKL